MIVDTGVTSGPLTFRTRYRIDEDPDLRITCLGHRLKRQSGVLGYRSEYRWHDEQNACEDRLWWARRHPIRALQIRVGARLCVNGLEIGECVERIMSR